MSELLVNTIKKADGTGSLTVPAESGTVVTTASPSLGRRNLIINGAMQVAQRGTSFTGLTNGSSQYTLDRWAWSEGGAPSFVTTVTQDSDSPSGFANSYKVQTTTADDLGGSTEYLRIRHLIEAQNLQHLNYGTSDAKKLTLSFWVKSSLTGVGAVNFHSPDAVRMNTQNYTINSADTWEYKTITVDGDVGGSGITNDNGAGIVLNWLLSSGTGASNTATNNWESYDSTKFASGQTLDVVGTLNATFQITGVQLEVGTVATPFEHRSYGEELALCQRYYEAGHARQYGSSDGTLNIVHEETFKVQKRTTPTMTNTSWTYARSGASGSVSVVNYGTTKDKHGRYGNIGATWVVGYFAGDWVADAEL